MSYEPMEAHDMELWEAINENNDLRLEVDELRRLVGDMHSLLQQICESRDECGRDCELWPDHNKQCDLRDVEERMVVLGIEVQG